MTKYPKALLRSTRQRISLRRKVVCTVSAFLFAASMVIPTPALEAGLNYSETLDPPSTVPTKVGPIQEETEIIAEVVEEKVITWQDNPNNCDTNTQWIGSSPPFNCIDKKPHYIPTNTPNQPQQPQAALSAAYSAYSSLPGLATALGSRYVFGGVVPGAFDCSGLTMWMSSQRGYSVPRSSSAQINGLRHISIAEALPGDIVGFNYGHVGMYLGGGKVVHALNPQQGVVLEDLQSAIKWNGFITMLAVGH